MLVIFLLKNRKNVQNLSSEPAGLLLKQLIWFDLITFKRLCNVL